jgi:hypothetical protein
MPEILTAPSAGMTVILKGHSRLYAAFEGYFQMGTGIDSINKQFAESVASWLGTLPMLLPYRFRIL